MIDFNTFFSTIYDKSKSIGHRTAVFFSMIGLIMIIELIFNFTYDIYISNKLSNLKTIYELKEIYKNDSVETAKLRADEIRILNRWHYSELLPFYNYSKPVNTDTVKINTTQYVENKPLILNKEDSLKINQLLNLSDYKEGSKDYTEYLQFFDSLRNSQQKIVERTEIKSTRQIIRVKPDTRSRLWMFVSANLFFIILCVFLLFVPFFSKDQKKLSLFVGLFASIVIISLIMLLTYWAVYFIPLLFGNPVYNYVLNIVIHLIITNLTVRGVLKLASNK